MRGKYLAVRALGSQILAVKAYRASARCRALTESTTIRNTDVRMLTAGQSTATCMSGQGRELSLEAEKCRSDFACMQTGDTAAARVDADVKDAPGAVPEAPDTSRPHKSAAHCYASLAQIADRLANQTSQVHATCPHHGLHEAFCACICKAYPRHLHAAVCTALNASC